MAVRYVVEDNSWRGEVNVPRKEFGFNRLRYLWEHCDFSQVCERSSQWCELRYSQVQTAH